MSKKTKEMTLEIKKTALYRKGSEIIKMLDEMNAGDTLPVKVLLSVNGNSGTLEAYVDEVAKPNAIGMVQTSDELIEVMHDIEDEKCSYVLQLVGHNGNLMQGNLKLTYVQNKEVRVDTSVFDDLKNKIVSEGICSAEDLERNINVMKAHRCPDELIRTVLSSYRKYEKRACVPKTIYIDPNPKSKEASLFSLCLLNTMIGAATIYEGDKSVGKNVCAETVAMVLNMPYYMITFNRGMTADDIYGTKSTDNSAASMLTEDMAEDYLRCQMGEQAFDMRSAATFEYLKAKAASVSIVQEQSCLVEWLKNGGVMCFNEMNMADANFFASFANQITDGSGFIDIPGYGNVKINKDCILIGTQNAEYTGTCEQNDATMSRFGCIQFDYPSSIKAQLQAVVGKDTLDSKYFTQTDDFYKVLLKAVHKGQVDNSCLNIRGFIRALLATAKIPGLTTLRQQIGIHVINTCPIDDRATLTTQLNEIVQL